MDSIKGLGPGKRSCTMPREVSPRPWRHPRATSRGIVHEHFRVQLKQPKRFLARDWKHAGFLFFGFSPATGSTPGSSGGNFGAASMSVPRSSFSPSTPALHTAHRHTRKKPNLFAKHKARYTQNTEFICETQSAVDRTRTSGSFFGLIP